MSSSLPLSKIAGEIATIIVDAGAIMLEGSSSLKELEFKSSVDIVTNVDKKVEEFLKARLAANFPDYLFLGEEEAATEGETLTDKPTWVVDPIDGTTNFVHKCVSAKYLPHLFSHH